MKYLLYSGLILIIISVIIRFGYLNDYSQKYFYDCIVVERLAQPAGYKVSGKYILVLRHENHSFDITVSPTCYATAEKGEILTFKLNKSLVEPDSELDLLSERCSYIFFLGLFILVVWASGKLADLSAI